MKTLTALKNAQKALELLNSHSCADFHAYNNCIDWNSLVKTLETLNFTIKAYEEKSVMRNAKLIENSINEA